LQRSDLQVCVQVENTEQSAFCLLTHKIMIEALSLLAGILIVATLVHVCRITEGANDPTIQATGEGVPTTVPPEFQTLLDTYTRNYVAYATNKDAGSQQAYTRSQQGIDEAITALQTTANQNKQNIQEFISNNPDTNAIESLHEQSQSLEASRPKLEDQQVLASKQVPPSTGIHSAALLLKSGLILVCMVLFGVLSAV
jgi:hypothetical protein